MNTEKVVFSKLFKDSNKHKARFNKHKVKLGLAQDLKTTIDDTAGILETGQKVVDIAINVNNELEKLTEDVRFHNKYKEITYDDLSMRATVIEDLMSKVEELASNLGISPEELDGYDIAKNTLIDIQTITSRLNTHTLNFDI
jgi:hypothetical protein